MESKLNTTSNYSKTLDGRTIFARMIVLVFTIEVLSHNKVDYANN